MNGTEIITFLSNNFPTVMGAVGSITGGLFTAIFLRHNTSSAEFEKIKAGQFKEVADNLLASGKMTYTEYYKANNFLIVAKKADELYLENHSDNCIINASYDFDWFVRFYEAVGNVSDNEMQKIWAKLMAGEIAEPSSYSLKTIDILRNMSKKDAELFVNICSHSFMYGADRLFLPNNDEYLKEFGIYYTDIMKLSEQGLIFNDGSISLNITINKKPKILFINNELVMTISATNDNEIRASIQEYPFTQAGFELASLVTKCSTDDCFIKYGRCLVEEYKNYVFAVYKVISWHEDSVKHENTNLLVDVVNDIV